MPSAHVVLILGGLSITAASVAAQDRASGSNSLALTHVTVIDVTGGQLLTDATVVITSDRISALGRTGTIEIPATAQMVDATGKYLIPGLWDMHVHLSYSTASALPVLLANGITGVRDMGSDLAEIDAWRAEIAAGVRAGPRIVRAGPMLNGQRFNRYQLVTGGPEQARGIVRTLKQVGVDFIKVHRRVPREDYFAIIDEARKQGLAVVGHIPITVRPEEASDAGQFIEHEETLFEGTFSAGLSPAELPDSIQRFLASGASDSLFARLVRNHTPLTSTLIAWRYGIQFSGDTTGSDPRMKYIARFLKEAFKARPVVSAQDLPYVKRVVAEYRQVLSRLNRSGVMLLAGSDIPGGRFPGFALHDELAELVDAGLTPIQALRAATLNPATILKKDSDFGSVAVGKLADLVLLDANPLDDIRNTRRISAVVVGGKFLDRAALDGLLASGARLAAQY